MFNVLNAFAAGIMFSVGVCVGAFLCHLASKKGRDEMKEQMLEYNKQVESRLAQYVENTAVMAAAAQRWMDKNPDYDD
ncbi:hypothetical protein PDESU_03321 [Pontiella desulfatans]|uniref:Uncharacterized protein n=1 Tax=Pontiella desulfatans TaxID=2750659 RepID=A0A6C2U400_PONDE|nr:hypothetical protein [Pontiella desulfatans]VGO14752.1 hypothetical protein PDESU_03321 [Pontiella desulfatans]